VVAVGGADPEAAFGATREAFLAHEAGDAAAAMSVAVLAQGHLNAGADAQPQQFHQAQPGTFPGASGAADAVQSGAESGTISQAHWR